MTQWYQVVRDQDVTQILSGTGVVAWVLELDHGYLMWWDTVINGEATQTLEWFDTKKKFDDIHGHGGATRLVPVDADHARRGCELMDANVAAILHTFADLLTEISGDLLAEIGDA